MPEGLKLSTEQLGGLGLGGDAELLMQGLADRRRIKMEQDMLKAEADEVNERILGLMVMHDIQSISGPEGTMSHKHGTNRTINRDKITNAMLGEGIGADVINKVLEAGTTISEYDTIEFRLPRR